MKTFKRWFIGILSTLFALLCILLIFVLNPSLLYAHKTTFDQFTVFHQKPLDKHAANIFKNAIDLARQSEIYNPAFKIDVCLNDGSIYPRMIQTFHKPAFGIGFYNKVILMGTIYFDENRVELNGYRWNLTQLIAHEAIHCYQFDKMGLWKSNPIAGYPNWKWEGYNEYVARRDSGQLDLAKNIYRLIDVEKKDKGAWAVYFDDSTIAGKLYYTWWVEMQYCKDVKGMSYSAILKDTTPETTINRNMYLWYNSRP